MFNIFISFKNSGGLASSTKSVPVPLPSIHDIRYENFLHTDKLKLAQAFITSDEVVKLIQNSMFLNKAMESLKVPQQPSKLEYSSSRSTLSKTILVGNKPNTNRKRDKSGGSNMLGKTASYSLFY